MSHKKESQQSRKPTPVIKQQSPKPVTQVQSAGQTQQGQGKPAGGNKGGKSK